MRNFKGTQKTGSNWAINVNNPKQTIIENICIIDGPWSDPIVQADAYLISSSPDLLEVCVELLKFTSETKGHVSRGKLVEMAELAINKALGGSDI